MGFGKGLPDFIPSFTYQPRKIAVDIVTKFEGKKVVDLGAGGRKIAPWVTTVDAVNFPNTDVVCDFINGKTPFDPDSVDLIVSTGVLEHVEDDRVFIGEIRRILKPGGTVHIELPFLQQYHEDPIDCRRLTLPGLKLFLQQNGFRVQEHGVHIGPTVTILTLISYYIDLILNGRSIFRKIISNMSFIMFSTIFWPARYLDCWLITKSNAHRLAFGVYATATKDDE